MMSREVKGKKTTFVDFGIVDPAQRRTSYEYHTGQEAYDLYMGARYAYDLIHYKNGHPEMVFHPEDLRDQIRKFSALMACKAGTKKPLVYHEVGSSVLGVIEALEFLDGQSDPQLDVKGIKFRGVDNSVWMNQLALGMHQNHDVQVWDDASKTRGLESDLFFAKGVSLMYAYDNVAAMCDPLLNSRISMFDYTFSRGETIHDVIGTGLPVTFLNLQECKGILEGVSGKELVTRPFVIKKYNSGVDRVTLDCVYGDTDVVQRYFAELESRTGENRDNYGNPRFIRQEERVVPK